MRTSLILAAAVLLSGATAFGQRVQVKTPAAPAAPGGTNATIVAPMADQHPATASGTLTLTGGGTAVSPFPSNAIISKGSGNLTFSSVVQGMEPKPALILTTALAAGPRQEWKEDLEVMDRVVRDAISSRSDGSPQAMGIYVNSTHGTPPTYIEGCGVVIEASVAWPLTGQAKPAGTNAPPAAATSAWDRAKDQLQHRGTFTLENSITPVYVMTVESYDPARVEALRKSLIAALVEGRHFRHLSANESVIITVTGAAGENREPSRMTLTAKKSDMDAAGESPAAAAAFESKVKSLVE